MRLIENLKSNKSQAHFIALAMYIIGVICDIYGYINVGVETVAYLFLSCFSIYGCALAIIWYINNNRYLKAARVHMGFLILGIFISFLTWHLKMYPTFILTIVFVSTIAILFIINLCRICYAYYYDKWN